MAIAPIDLAAVTAGTSGFVIHGELSGDQAGYAVASAGDINGDGFDDLLIGAPFAVNNSGNYDAGRAYVVFGNGSDGTAAIDLSQVALGIGGFVIRGEDSLDQAGIAVASAGDINGDGFADIAIGVQSADGPAEARVAAGATYVIFGQATLGAPVDLAIIAAGTGGFVVHGADAGDLSGTSLAAGDVNGDGIDDLLIGAPNSDGAGAGFVVFGRTTGFGAAIDLLDLAETDAGFKLAGSVSGGQSGISVAVGDLDGDGIAELIFGGPGTDGPGNGFPGAGGGHVVTGATWFDGDPVPLAEAGVAHDGAAILGQGDGVGFDVAYLGDVNGDGFGDFAISAPAADDQRGQTYVVFGTAGGLPAVVNLIDIAAGTGGFMIQGQGVGDQTGYAVAGAGDINGDGFDDMLIGAYGGDSVDDLRADAGEAYVLLGRASFGATVAVNTLFAGEGGFALYGETADDRAGSAVAAAGDLNGDGFADLVIGARSADGAANAVPNAGGTYVVYGSDLTGTVTHAGDGDANLFNGASGADVMVGGRGADVLLGNGGADVLIGGAGDDILAVAGAGFHRIDGGTGFDVLALTGAGEVLDLRGDAGRRTFGIEAISLTGDGNNELVLDPQALFRLSERTNTLLVLGDAGDSTVLHGAGWAPTSGPAGFVTWANGEARLQVAEDVTVIPCFATGSHIATARGEVRVEDLREGDIAVLADGTRRTVRWIGHREVRIARHPRPWDVQPIRIRADAFGPGRPYRDLRLSPDHAVFAHGALVPVRHLVNGATIVQEHVGDITYWHVELAADDGSAAHHVLLAEGLPVESFLDTGNRGAFANGGATTMLHPDFALRTWEASACAPLLRDGPALADLRTELLAEATALGWEVTPDPDLRLLVDGRPVWPQLEEGRYVVRLSAGARIARLRSRSTTPAWLRCDTNDRRRLGVAVTHLTPDGITIALDDPRLSGGWHPAEGDWRWTDGDAALPVAGARLLTLAVAPLEQYWRRPAAAPVAKGGGRV